jgi:hypothetical protein
MVAGSIPAAPTITGGSCELSVALLVLLRELAVDPLNRWRAIATSRSSRPSRARYTSPIPPAPMGATIS